GRDPVEDEPGGEADHEGDEDEGQDHHHRALAFVGGDGHHQAGDQLRADIENEQHDQFRAGRPRGQVVDKEEGRSAAAFPRLTADVGGKLVAKDVEEGDENRQLGNQRDTGGEWVDFVLLV